MPGHRRITKVMFAPLTNAAVDDSRPQSPSPMRPPNGPLNSHPVDDSRVRRPSSVRPPNGPLNSHPVDEATLRLVTAAAKRAAQRNRHMTIVEAPPSGSPDMPQGTNYLVLNEANTPGRPSDTTGECPLSRLHMSNGAKLQKPAPKTEEAGDGSTGARGRVEEKLRGSLRRRTSQKLKRSVSNLRAKYRANETGNHPPLPVPRLVNTPERSRSVQEGPSDHKPQRRRSSLRQRTSRRLQCTASGLGRRLSSGCRSSNDVSSDSDESPLAAADRKRRAGETEALARRRQILALALPGYRRQNMPLSGARW